MSAVANTAKALHKPTQAKNKYRPEIDGLRAFAVVAVIINHFNNDLLPSGYLGVDIFFVISGYVITSSLADRQSKNFLDFVTGFYERRIKRLVPALVVFVLITSVLICLFNPDPGNALGLGWKSLFGLSNISLYRSSTDYFAQSTELNPFTHTWSLGVEEQFYLLFPLLIWFSGFGQQTAKGARNLFFWVGALTIASLIGFIYLYRVNQPAAYFLMPTRFWEMASGCLIFIGFQKRVKIEQVLEKVSPLLVVTATVAVMLLPVSAAVPATIGIVVLSAVLIASLKKGTAAYQFFTLEKVVYVGLISYSLYLWHWTVLSISRWTIGIHWWSVPFQITLMIAISLLSFAFIEKPIRKKDSRSAPRHPVVLGIAFIFFASLLQQVIANLVSYVGESKHSVSDLDGCSQNLSSPYWLIGDSHSGEMQKAISIATGKNCHHINMLTVKSREVIKMEGYHNVYKNIMRGDLPIFGSSELVSSALKHKPRFMVFNLYWQGYFSNTQLPSYDGEWRKFRKSNENKEDFKASISRTQALDYFLKGLSDLSRKIGKGTTIIIVTPEPEFNWINMGGIGDRKKVFAICQGNWFSFYKAPQSYQDMCNAYKKGATISTTTLRERSRDITSALSSEIENSILSKKSLLLFDTIEILCEPEFCSTHSRGGKLLYRDDDHINSNAAEILGPKWKKILLVSNNQN